MVQEKRRAGSRSTEPFLPSSSVEFGKPGMFTPEGRLLQVEWARKCPSGGYLAVAMKTVDGLLLAKEKESLSEHALGFPPFWHLGQSLAFVATGNLGDMFYIHDTLTIEGIHRFGDASRRIRGILHEHAISTVKRPLSLFILLGGFEDGAQKIAELEVLGIERQHDACAIGYGEKKARTLLKKYWTPTLNEKSALQLIRRIYGSSASDTCFLLRPVSG